jgi:CRISPR-associated endonuclease/helicase Cas3
VDPSGQQDEQVRRLLLMVPPRSTEAVELPLWVVRRWLDELAGPFRTRRRGPTSVRPAFRASDALLADVAGAIPEEQDRGARGEPRRVFRWRGDDERSGWVDALALRPGDTIVAPASYGGLDRFGWHPESTETVVDVARSAAEPFAGRRFAVRVAPGLLGDSGREEALADALAAAPSRNWRDLRAAVLDSGVAETVRADLEALDTARKGKVSVFRDVYGEDDGRPRGIVFVAPFGVTGGLRQAEPADAGAAPGATEDDGAGSAAGVSVPLDAHEKDVAAKVALFARRAGLCAAICADLERAAHLHDLGKADPRYQAWLYYGDPLGGDPDRVLAKSGRFLPPAARSASGLPDRWRHEALSVRLARTRDELGAAHDPELVLWLVGTHHGHGRPLYPHCDPAERAPDVGPQSLAFDWRGLDWPNLFARLKARYGAWELARMEAVLRLADHRASEEEALREDLR